MEDDINTVNPKINIGSSRSFHFEVEIMEFCGLIQKYNLIWEFANINVRFFASPSLKQAYLEFKFSSWVQQEKGFNLFVCLLLSVNTLWIQTSWTSDKNQPSF